MRTAVILLAVVTLHSCQCIVKHECPDIYEH